MLEILNSKAPQAARIERHGRLARNMGATMGFFGTYLYAQNRWSEHSAGFLPTVTEPWLLVDIHDSDFTIVTYRPAGPGSGVAYLGITPRDYFEDPTASEPTDVTGEAAGLAFWWTQMHSTGDGAKAGQLATFLAADEPAGVDVLLPQVVQIAFGLGVDKPEPPTVLAWPKTALTAPLGVAQVMPSTSRLPSYRTVAVDPAVRERLPLSERNPTASAAAASQNSSSLTGTGTGRWEVSRTIDCRSKSNGLDSDSVATRRTASSGPASGGRAWSGPASAASRCPLSSFRMKLWTACCRASST
jgi:hypothetical protein